MNILKDLNQRQREVEISLLIFFISFVVYLKTLCPTIYVGDSGELIAAAYCLGIPHPPGYPLYCLLGRLFTFLPFASIAYRVNLMSAFFASLTVVLTYFIILKLPITAGTPTDVGVGSPITKYVPAISSSLLFAFSLTFWSQAVVAEVYTLNTFFAALTLLLLVLWNKKRDNKYLYCFALIYGLSLTNHYIMFLLFPAYLLYILWTEPKIIKETKTLFIMLGLFLLGLMPYFYLPIRSLQNPPIDWGNPENLPNFLAHMGRMQYRELEFGQEIGFKTKALFIGNFFRQLAKQFPISIGWIGIVGLFWGLYRSKKLFVTTFLVFLFTSLGLIFLLRFPYEPSDIFRMSVYYLPSYLVFSLWMGYGIGYLIFKGVQLNRGVKIGFGTRNSYKYLSTILILTLPLLPLSRNYFRNDRSRHYFAYDLGMNILKTLEQDAVLFTQGDVSTFSLAYLTVVEGKRPDVVIYHRDGSLFPDIYGFKEMDFDQETKEERQTRVEKEIITSSKQPIYYEEKRDMTSIPGYILRPAGLLYQIAKEKESEKLRDYWKEYHVRGINNKSIFKDDKTRNIISWYHSHWQQHYFKEKL